MMNVNLPILDSCEGCGGACCREQGSPPMYLYWLIDPPVEGDDDFGDEDAEAVRNLPTDLKLELMNYADRRRGSHQEDDGPCLWLDDSTGQCKHYEQRPSICRDFERSYDECHAWRETWKPK